MAVQIVAGSFGDRQYRFDPEDDKAAHRAELRFRVLTGRKGMIAYDLGHNGEGASLLRKFDATVEKTAFFPQRQGG